MLNDKQRLTSDMHPNDIIDVLSNGNEDAKEVLDAVYKKAGDFDKSAVKTLMQTTYHNKEMWRAYASVGSLYLLALDDMNIRGNYVNYAYDYCNNDMQVFIEKIRGRDCEMVDYVNQRAVDKAETNWDDYVPKAVTMGASSDGFYDDTIYAYNYSLYKKDIQPLGIDYSKLEVCSGTSLNTALKVFKANGFEMVYDEPNGKSVFNTDCRCIVMQNPITGAIMSAPNATPEDVCYGGCDITIPTKSNDKIIIMNNDIETDRANGHPDITVNYISYQNNLMKNYNTIIHNSEPVADSTVLGYQYHGIDLPLTEKYDDKFILHRNFKYPEFYHLSQDGSVYDFNAFMTCLKADKTIKDVKPDKQWLYKPFLDDKHNKTMSIGYFSNSVETNSLLIGACFKICGISDSEIDKYYEAAVRSFDRYGPYTKERELKLLNENRDVFYGNSDTTRRFLEEFNLKPAVPFDDDKKKCNEHRVALAEALCPTESDTFNDYQYD